APGCPSARRQSYMCGQRHSCRAVRATILCTQSSSASTSKARSRLLTANWRTAPRLSRRFPRRISAARRRSAAMQPSVSPLRTRWYWPMGSLYKRFGGGLSTIFVALVFLWLAGMVLAPNIMMVDYALRPNLPPSQIGGPNDVYSFDNMLYLANEGVHR